MAGGSRVSTSGGSRVSTSGGSRVSLTGGVWRMIQNIKEITGNESDDEVYAMLKECGMDPNETTQKLLLQDTFHEVKRKRDKRKESYREPVDSRWRTAMPGRGGRGGRGIFPSRHSSNDAGGGGNASAATENTVNQVTDKRNASSSPTAPELETTHSISMSRSEAGLSIGPAKVDHSISPHSCTTQVSGSSDIISAEENSASETKRAGPTSLFSVDIKDGSSGIKHDVAIQRISVEATNTKAETSVNKITSQTVPSSSGSRPSSNYGNRPPPTGAQKGAGPSKEWKPKSVHINPQLTGIHASEVVPITTEALDTSLPSSSTMASDATTSKLETKMVDLQLSETQYVIIPHHLQVPDYERHGLTFGSFGPTSEGRSTSASELSQDVEENVEELSLSIDNDSPTAQKEDSPGHFQIPTQILENQISSETNAPSGVSPVPEHDQSGADSSLGPEGPHQSVVNTAPSYPTLELLPQIPENSESQSREVTRIPSFVVQPTLHSSTSFYNHIYSPSIGTDDRFSPYLAPGGVTKYNGNIMVLPSQTGQSPQEVPGVMQSLPQQPVPVFRQPGGVHLSHYPNFIPYSQYISPFYIPPPTVHHFVSNAALPPQPPTSNIYPPPATATAVAPIKYPVSQYKPGTNTGNSNHLGLAIGYGAYNSNPAGYNLNSSAISTGNEDHTASQFKENNAYITSQQSEGSAFWVPGRDIPSLQFNSFYNPPHPQGPHMTFGPAPPAHGAIAGIYHPSQAMTGAVEVVGPTAGVYQQPQRAQINWANNYRGME